MAIFSTVQERLRDFFSSSKRRNWTILSILILLLFLLFRSSSSYSLNHAYKVGLDPDWPTLDLMGKERQLNAFNADLLSVIGKQVNLRFHLIQTAHYLLLSRLDNGELDGITTTLQPSPIYESSYLFSNPYFLLGPVLIISSRAPIEGWNEMAVKIIGVPSNSPASLNLEDNPSFHIKLYDNILPALADLDEHRIDGVIFPALPAYVYTQTFYEGRLKIATIPLNDDGIRLMALKNDKGAQLIEEFNEGLKAVKENNKYEDLLFKWSFFNIEKPLNREEGK